MQMIVVQFREGEAPAEPKLARKTRLGGSLALPLGAPCDCTASHDLPHTDPLLHLESQLAVELDHLCIVGEDLKIDLRTSQIA